MRQLAPLSPALVVAGANALAGLRSTVSPEWIEPMLRRCGRSDGRGPWHTAFVHHVGYTAHYDVDARHSSWPLPATADCAELARFAYDAGIVAEQPLLGDILLLWSGRESRFMRSGIVVGLRRGVSRLDDPCFECTTVEGEGCTTIEGEGAASAPGVYAVTRRIRPANGHRFVRWVDLDGRPKPASPPVEAEQCVGRMLCAR